MNLTPMRYKSYTWPHNPRVYSIDYRRTMAVHKNPFQGYQLQDLGTSYRVMEGEGEFVGAGAYTEFQRLASVFYSKGPGLLVHPLWQAANTYFVALRLEQAPRPDYVRYSFQFWEENSQYGGLAAQTAGPVRSGETGAGGRSQPVYHTVARGETLWALSSRYGVKLEELTALNPQIKNPNLIQAGQEVRIG